jgi:hypothetical protein
MRTFNTTGPCDPAHHYALPSLERSARALPLIRGMSYLNISGPRQSGKTSLLKALAENINGEGWARAVLLTCEAASERAGVTDLGDAERRMVEQWHSILRRAFPSVAWSTPEQILSVGPGARIGRAFGDWATESDRPLVLIVDEIDSLAREPFLSMLSQLRAEFPNRPRNFPFSVVLAGMRSLRDHDIALGGTGRGSPFNIVEFLTVTNFTREEIRVLYSQHTTETGQRFSDDALAFVWDQTRGQPWLVNAIARSCVTELVTDVRSAVEAPHVEEAIRRLEAARPTHLVSLAARLEEERVLRVVAPVVVGDAPEAPLDDRRYAIELGLLTPTGQDGLEPSNPIYARALLRLVTERPRLTLAQYAPTWLDGGGHVDLVKLREAFLTFWAQHRGMLAGVIPYAEAVPHFGLMTWLDRVANGGGRVDREFAVGRGRLDLLLVHGELRLPIEVKVHRDDRGDPVPEGLVQLDRYCAGLRVDTGWLVVFDQRSGATGTRLECEEVVTEGGRTVTVIRA